MLPDTSRPSTTALQLHLGDQIRDADGQLVGTIDRAVVTPDLHTVTHVGVQPVQSWKWPRLVDVADLRADADHPGGHRLSEDAAAWPGDRPTADVLPGVDEDELPDHPITPTSSIQQFLLSFTSPASGGAPSVAARAHHRTPEGQVLVQRGDRLVEADEHALNRLGTVVGLVVDPPTHAVSAVLVRHRQGLHQRTATVPIAEIREAGIHQVTTSLSRHDLDRYDERP